MDSTPEPLAQRGQAGGDWGEVGKPSQSRASWEMSNPWGEPSQLGAEQSSRQPSQLGR